MTKRPIHRYLWQLLMLELLKAKQLLQRTQAKGDQFFQWARVATRAYLFGDVRLSKPLLRNNWSVCFWRIVIHLVPISVSISLVVLNMAGWFIGREMEGVRGMDDIKLATLQVAAKAHELLIVGSLSVVIYDMIRNELIYGDGLPVGLIGAGKSFSSVSFLVSGDFLGSLFHPRSHRLRGIALILIILVSVIIASFAGPASAVLAIPRSREWTAGGLYMWLNGTKEDLWPSRLDSTSLSPSGCSTFLRGRGCIATAYPTMRDSIGRWLNESRSGGTEFVVGEEPDYRKIYIQSRRHTDYPNLESHSTQWRETWAFTSTSMVAEMQSIVYQIWSSALFYQRYSSPDKLPRVGRFDLAAYRKIVVESELPAVRVTCNQAKTIDFPGPVSLDFPVLPEYGRFSYQNPVYHTVDVTDTVEGKLKLSSDMSSHRRVVAASMPLPALENQAASLGIVILKSGQESGKNASSGGLEAAACSVDARWATGKTVVEEDRREVHRPSPMNDVRSLVIRSETESDVRWLRFSPPIGGTWRKLEITNDWFQKLTPRRPPTRDDDDDGLKNETTVDQLLSYAYASVESTPDHDRVTWRMEFALALLIVDGIARSSSHRFGNASHLLGPAYSNRALFSGDRFWEFWKSVSPLAERIVYLGEPKQTYQPPDRDLYTRHKATAFLEAYAIKSTGKFDIFCIIILLTHVIIALGHIAVVLWKTQVKKKGLGNAWENISDLVALASRSQPARNAELGAGKGQRVQLSWIVAVKGENSTGNQSVPDVDGRLQLKVGEARLREPDEVAIACGKVYE